MSDDEYDGQSESAHFARCAAEKRQAVGSVGLDLNTPSIVTWNLE